MSWLVWRQHRGELRILLLVLLVAGAATVWLGTAWATHAGVSPQVLAMTLLLLPFPLLPGLLIGAPLVAREAERGTLRLAWTQSQTRLGWLFAHATLVVGALAVGVGVLQVAVTLLLFPHLAASPIGVMTFVTFDQLGVLPACYSVFSVCLGICAGAATRRTIAAILLTLVLGAGVRVGFDAFLLPRLEPPVTTVGTVALKGPFSPTPAGSETISWSFLDAGGHRSNQPACLPRPKPTPCVARYVATYQPASRFWRFQLTEGAFYLLISALLLGGAACLVRRRGT
ncbi:MAG: hypothetical protein ACREQM_17845 [Candidatus Dormibacteraceae bacterium]